MNIIQQNIINTLENNYMPYAMSVIVSRALPGIDGFKPSHRKLLYTMYSMNLLKGKKTKSANIVGQTMKLNPHGDQAIYETMVRLTKGYEALLHPLVDSKGNFGKQYSRDMKYAASRYTEAKLSLICEEIFRDIEKNNVDFEDNYDGTLKEPILLPTVFPNILVSANQGIAVGMASNMCGFNLKEVCETTIEYIKNENINISTYLKAPDFPSGGTIIYNDNDMQKIYNTGKGSFKIRAKYRYVKEINCIEITEIPYTTTVEAIIDKIIELIKSNKIKEISDIRDETDLNGLKLTIDLKRNTNAEDLMNKLYKFTPLEDSFNANFNLLIDNNPKVMGIKEILSHWLSFRVDTIKRTLVYDINKKEEKRHLLLGLKEITLDIDKAITIIRDTEKDRDVIQNLISGFSIDKIQAEYVADIKLRYLNKEYLLNRINELEKLEKEINNLNSNLNNDKKIKNIIIKELKDISKKYGIDRKTDIVFEEHIDVISKEDLIEDYNLKLFFTEHNYLKKIPLTSLRSNPAQNIKEDDRILQELVLDNKNEIILFSDKQNAYKLKLYKIDDCKPSSLGIYIPNLFKLEDENITYITSANDYKGYIIVGYEDGKLSKIPLEYYKTKTTRKKLVGAYSEKSNSIGILYIEDDCELVLTKTNGKEFTINTKNITIKSKRNAQGVQMIKTSKNIKLDKISTKHIKK